MALHHLSEGRTSINQITLSPTDGRSFSFQRCIDENISTKLFLHLVSLHLILVVTFRQKWPVGPMMPRGCLFWASLTMSLPLSLSLSLSLYLSLSLPLSFFGQIMSPHHSDQLSQRSQVSRIAPFECSLMEVHR